MRAFPRDVTASVQIFRRPSTGDQKYPSTPTYTVEGALNPFFSKRSSHSIQGGMYVIEYVLYVDETVDIQPSDKLVIVDRTGTTGTYLVRQVNNLYMGTFPLKYVMIAIEA